MQDITLSTTDLVIVAAYFLLVFAIGFRAARRTHSAEDLFLAGRQLGWLPIGLSLFASNISSTTMIGLAGAAYTWGIAVANYEWMAAPILVVFALFLAPLYLNARIGTVPEFLEYRYDRHVRRYFSLLTIVANIVVDTAGTLFAGAIVLTVFMPELDLFSAALTLAAIAGLYTAAGGLAGPALYPYRRVDLCRQQCDFLAVRTTDGTAVAAAGCPLYLQSGDYGANRGRPMVEGLSCSGCGTAAVDPLAGSGFLVIKGFDRIVNRGSLL